VTTNNDALDEAIGIDRKAASHCLMIGIQGNPTFAFPSEPRALYEGNAYGANRAAVEFFQLSHSEVANSTEPRHFIVVLPDI